MVAWVGLVYRALPPSNGKVDWGSQGRAVREADKQDFTFLQEDKTKFQKVVTGGIIIIIIMRLLTTDYSIQHCLKDCRFGLLVCCHGLRLIIES
jgi:hypothetical protein